MRIVKNARAALLGVVLSLLVAPAAARADVVPVQSGSGSGTTTAQFALPIPAGNERLLAVGVSTLESVTVTSVTRGSQALTRQADTAADGVRSEIWTLTAPATGTANVTVTVSGTAPVIAGATAYTGVEQTLPIISSATGTANQASNSASLVLNSTTVRDGMFGTIALGNAPNTSAITNQGSVDTVVADTRWSTSEGVIRGAGATRTGNTGANMALYAGVVWRWTFISPGELNPYAQSLVGLRASSATATAPVVTNPSAASITPNTAVLGGTLSATGGQQITQRGVAYCTCANPQVGGAGVTTVDAGPSDVTGPFTVNASGLTPSTTYTMRAFAANATGTGYSETRTFTTSPPPNRPPTADAGGPYTASEGSGLTLDASGSSDPDGDALSYAWDVNGDGVYGDATGVSPALTGAAMAALGLGDGPTARGVSVRVSDGPASTDSTSAPLTITNVAPSGTLSNDGPVVEGGAAQVSFTAVTDPSAADTAGGVRYAFDFDNDGTWDVGGATYAAAVTSASASVPAALLADGPIARTVRGAVVDKDGGLTTYTTSISVANAAPTGTFTGTSVDEGTSATVTFSGQDDASAADAAAGFTYEYDLDDDGTFETAGTSPTATLPAALTADDGTLPVHGAIVDRDGGRTEYSATVEVENVAPTATLTGPAEVPPPGAVSLTLDAGDAGDDDLTTSLDWGDGTVETLTGTGARSVSHTYAAAGAYVVTAVARDDDGGESPQARHALTVAAAPTAPSAVVPDAAPPASPLRIRGVGVTPRCIRARTARTLAARFNLSAAADIRLTIHRRIATDGRLTCPAAAKSSRQSPDGYRQAAQLDVDGREGVNRVRFARTGRGARALRPGTYLLTVSAGGVTTRTRFWVLASRRQVPRQPQPCARTAGETATASC